MGRGPYQSPRARPRRPARTVQAPLVLVAAQVDDGRRRARQLAAVEHEVGAGADRLGDVGEPPRVGAAGRVGRALQHRDRARPRASGTSGTRRPSVVRVRAAGEREAAARVRQQQRDGAGQQPLERRARARAESGSAASAGAEREEHDRRRLVRRAALERVEPLDRRGRLGVAREPVDRVGREHDHAAVGDGVLERAATRSRRERRRARSSRAAADQHALDPREVRRPSRPPGSRPRASAPRPRAACPAPISSATVRAAVAPTAGSSRRITSSPSGPARSASAGS